MLEGWYCRSLASEQQPNQRQNMGDDSDDSQMEENSDSRKNAGLDYRAQYRYLKRKLKFLIYENEFFQEALRSNQRRLLKVSRDRAFLLDRLLHYEKPEMVSSEDEETESSDDDVTKRRKMENTSQQQPAAPPPPTGPTRGRKRKVPVGQNVESATTEMSILQEKIGLEATELDMQQGHMTAAEVERHLQSKQPVMELMPERAPATVPTEMFSNEPSLDSESNDHLIDGSSPTHVAAEECVPMEYTSDM